MEMSMTLGDQQVLQEFNLLFEDADASENGGTFARDTLFNKDWEIQQVSNGKGEWNFGTVCVFAYALFGVSSMVRNNFLSGAEDSLIIVRRRERSVLKLPVEVRPMSI